jgi:hypothetical protein
MALNVTYELAKWVINRNGDRARVHLHGEHKGHGIGNRLEIIEVSVLPDESEADIVRCAVAASPSKWHLHFRTDIAKFQGHFMKKIEDHLKVTVQNATLVSSHDG